MLPARWTLAARTNRLDNWTAVSKTQNTKNNPGMLLPDTAQISLAPATVVCIWSCRDQHWTDLIVGTSIVSLAVNCSLF